MIVESGGSVAITCEYTQLLDIHPVIKWFRGVDNEFELFEPQSAELGFVDKLIISHHKVITLWIQITNSTRNEIVYFILSIYLSI